MVKKKTDYVYTDGLDGITIDGSILPLRSGAARKLLKGEDLVFLAEALNERSLAANGEFALRGIGTNDKYTYKRNESEGQFLRIASLISDDVAGAGISRALNDSTELSEFEKLVDATGDSIALSPFYSPKGYVQSRIDSIGSAAYHCAELTPSPQTARIINIQDELDIFSNERKLVRFFRDSNFSVEPYPPPFTVVSTGIDEDGETISESHITYNSHGWCLGYQYDWGLSVYHTEEDRIGLSYTRSDIVWNNNYDDLQKVAMRIYNVPARCMVDPIIRILVVNRTTSAPGEDPIDTYVNRYFIGRDTRWKGFQAGENPTNTVEISWYDIKDNVVMTVPAWKPPFIHNDVRVPARKDQFNLMLSSRYVKYDCLEIYAQPIGAIIELDDHTKWWE